MDQIEQVVKGGIVWFNLGISRGKRGLNFFVKADPRLEDFVRSLGNGGRDNLEAYIESSRGTAWYPLDANPISVYRIDADVASSAYTVSHPGEPLRLATKMIGVDGKLNLSFLRFAGISSPDGINFGVAGPFSRQFVDKIKLDILLETKNLIRDYIAPISVNLRITSTEV